MASLYNNTTILTATIFNRNCLVDNFVVTIYSITRLWSPKTPVESFFAFTFPFALFIG